MMDLVALASSVVGALLPLLMKATEKGAEEVGEHVTSTLFEALKKRLAAPEAKAALADLASEPMDEDAQAALRRQIRKAMEADPALIMDLQTLLAENGPPFLQSQVANIAGNQNVIKQISGGSNNSIS